jgi:hypothetical protein
MAENKNLTPEQQAKLEAEHKMYVASFGEAMRSIEAEYKRRKVVGKAYNELVRRGMWDPEYISRMYVLIVGKLSPLSARLRNYILGVGSLAHKIYDEAAKRKNDLPEAPLGLNNDGEPVYEIDKKPKRKKK